VVVVVVGVVVWRVRVWFMRWRLRAVVVVLGRVVIGG
jgi:hypothetical protein